MDVNFTRNSVFTNQFRPSTFAPHEVRSPHYTYGHGGSNNQVFNNVQGYQTGHAVDHTGELDLNQGGLRRLSSQQVQLQPISLAQRPHVQQPSYQVQELLQQNDAEYLNDMQRIQPEISAAQELQAQNPPADEGAMQQHQGFADSEIKLLQLMRNNYHYGQHITKFKEFETHGERLSPAAGSALNLQPSKRCFASNHKHCNSQQNLHHSGRSGQHQMLKPPLAPSLHQNKLPQIGTHQSVENFKTLHQHMRQFDLEVKGKKYKNRDHFHLVQQKDVYDIIRGREMEVQGNQLEENLQEPLPQEAQALTKTIYSQDSSERVEMKKEQQQKYAEILIEQMKIKRQKKLREKVLRASLVPDLDIKPDPRVIVPDVPQLINRPKTTAEHSYADYDSLHQQWIAQQLNLPQHQYQQQQQNPEPQSTNLGFFDKFYGNEHEYQQQQKHQRQELQHHLTNQINQKESQRQEQRVNQLSEDQRMLNEPFTMRNGQIGNEHFKQVAEQSHSRENS